MRKDRVARPGCLSESLRCVYKVIGTVGDFHGTTLPSAGWDNYEKFADVSCESAKLNVPHSRYITSNRREDPDGIGKID